MDARVALPSPAQPRARTWRSFRGLSGAAPLRAPAALRIPPAAGRGVPAHPSVAARWLRTPIPGGKSGSLQRRDAARPSGSFGRALGGCVCVYCVLEGGRGVAWVSEAPVAAQPRGRDFWKCPAGPPRRCCRWQDGAAELTVTSVRAVQHLGISR